MNRVDKIDNLLNKAGLNKSERLLYTSASGKTLTSNELISMTNMPKATVMSAIKELDRVGLCKLHPKDKKSYFYEMMPLDNFKQSIGGQIHELNSMIADIDKLAQSKQPLLITQSATGREEVMELINMALFCRHRKWNIIAPYNNALRFMPADYIAFFKDTRLERQIVSQTLWEEAWRKDSLPLTQLLMRKPRFIGKEAAPNIPAMILTFDDKLLTIVGKENPVAELVTNKAIVDTFNIVFELAWRSSRE